VVRARSSCLRLGVSIGKGSAIGYFYHLSHVCSVFTGIYLKNTMLLGVVVLQLFCIYNLCYMQCYCRCSVFCTFTSALPEARVQCPIWLFYVLLISCLPAMLLRYFLNDCEMVTVAPVVTGITFFYTFHLPCITNVRSLY